MVGVNGVGKSTILHNVYEIHPEWDIVRGSAVLMDWLGIPGDYKALRALSQDHTLAEWGKLVESYFADPAKHLRLIDTHLLNILHGRLTDRRGDWYGKLDGIVLVTTDPETIYQRVEADHGIRDRALFPEGLSDKEKREVLYRYVEKTRLAYEEVLVTYGIKGCVIENTENAAHESAKELVRFVTSCL